MTETLLDQIETRVRAALATLKTDADVDAYLAELRERLMKHIGEGHTVII